MSPRRKGISPLLLIAVVACAATVAPVRAAEREDIETAPSMARALAERVLAAASTDADRRGVTIYADSSSTLEPWQREYMRVLSEAPAPGSVTVTSDGFWQALDGPPPDGFHSSVYDPIRRRVIVVGGANYGVWALNLQPVPSWTRVRPLGRGPLGLWGHAMIFDPTRDRIVLFGGGAEGWWGRRMSNRVYTLSLSGTPEWKLLQVVGPPPPERMWHTATYDAVRDRMLVFGGTNLDEVFSDLWALSLGDDPGWTRLEAPGNWPWPRALHSTVYDSRRDRLVVFGGYNELHHVTLSFDDVWVLPLGEHPIGRSPDHPDGNGVSPSVWSRLNVRPGGPGYRIGHSAFYDPGNDRMVTFGGRNEPTTNEVWALDFGPDAAWSQVLPAGALPDGRYAQSVSYDVDEGRMLMFGGFDGTTLRNDTWSLALGAAPAWSQFRFLEGPFAGARSGHTLIYDSFNDCAVLYGGDGFWSSGSSTWTLPLSGPMRPAPVITTGQSPLPRMFHSAIYDPVRKRMVVFGGFQLGVPIVPMPVLDDLWTLDLDGAREWRRVTTLGIRPSARIFHSAAYDPVRERMLIFGGQGASGEFNDIWELRLHGIPSWNRILPFGQPPEPRANATMVYDPVGDRVVIVGGRGSVYLYTDAWELPFPPNTNPRWSRLQTVGAPPGRTESVGVFDSARRRVVIHGGRVATDLDDAWAMSIDPVSTWTRLSWEGETPGPRRKHAAVYDPIRDRMLIFGGKEHFDYLGDLWALVWGGTAAADVSTETRSLAPGGAGPRSPAEDPVRDGQIGFHAGPESGRDLDPATTPFTPDRLGLRIAGGNPGGRELRYEYFVPSPGRDISISVVDVTGRCLARRAEGFASPGVHAGRFGADDLAAVRAGVYFLRLESPGATTVRKWVRME